jgi:PKD repeat protein
LPLVCSPDRGAARLDRLQNLSKGLRLGRGAADDGFVNVLLRSPLARLRALPRTAAALAVASVACLCFAPAAGAVVKSVGGLQYGVQPETAELPQPNEPLSYENGPVLHSTAPFALYWDPRPGRMRGSWEHLISSFLRNAGTASGQLNNDFAVLTQYHDTSGANAAYNMTFRGAFTDSDPYPTSGNCSEEAPCLTDAQIRAELVKYVTANGLPAGINPTTGATPVYYVFTPPGVSVCLDASGQKGHCSSQVSAHPMCSYHSFIPPTGQLAENVLYAVEPWTAGNLGTFQEPEVSGTDCQDGTGLIEEPNQIGLGPEGDYGYALADLIINNVADQALSTAINPLFNGWHDNGSDTNEVVDKCRTDFFGGEYLEPELSKDEKTKAGHAHNQTIAGVPYYLNDVWDQAAWFAAYPGVPCINGVRIEPLFTAPNTIKSGEPATFNATDSAVSLGIEKYNWTFGDGATAEVNCESRVPTNGFGPEECVATDGATATNEVASTTHAYTYGGTYPVTLTVVDYGGNVATVAREVTVIGPAPPPPPPGSGSGGATTGGATTGGASTTGAGATPSGSTTKPGSPGSPSPIVATAAVASHSLRTTLRSGLVIRYSVNQQVAGRFEVLLASSTARRIGLRGATAAGLARGSAAQTVIAKAVLVTTKGGRGTYRIIFSKATAARLRKLRSVTLTVRLVVHNASSAGATTVLSTAHLR